MCVRDLWKAPLEWTLCHLLARLSLDSTLFHQLKQTTSTSTGAKMHAVFPRCFSGLLAVSDLIPTIPGLSSWNLQEYVELRVKPRSTQLCVLVSWWGLSAV